MPECLREDLRDLLPLLLQGALPDAEAARLREHVAGCAACAAELAVLETTRRVLLAATPRLDVDRISAALSTAPALRIVRAASLPAARRPVAWGTRRFLAAAASLLVVGTLSVAVARRAIDGRVIAPADTTVVAAASVDGTSGLSMSGGLGDLTTDDLNALLAALDDVEGTVGTEPATLRGPLVDAPEGPR